MKQSEEVAPLKTKNTSRCDLVLVIGKVAELRDSVNPMPQSLHLPALNECGNLRARVGQVTHFNPMENRAYSSVIQNAAP